VWLQKWSSDSGKGKRPTGVPKVGPCQGGLAGIRAAGSRRSRGAKEIGEGRRKWLPSGSTRLWARVGLADRIGSADGSGA
jgi:hypothetical protein